MSMTEYKPPECFVQDGILLGCGITRQSLQRANRAILYPDDVIVLTYPKSGTTWVKFIAKLVIECGAEPQKGYDSLLYDVPFMELPSTSDALFSPVQPSPRLFVTHMSTYCLPQSALDNKTKIIHVRRDPKDVLVSYYEYHRISHYLGNYSGSWDEFYQLFMKKELMFGDVIKFNQTYWERREQGNILYVQYEEIKADLPGFIRKIAVFLNKTLSDEDVANIVDRASFKAMKSNPYSNPWARAKAGRYDPNKFAFYHVYRKGEIGDWRNYFSLEQLNYMDDRMRETNVVY